MTLIAVLKAANLNIIVEVLYNQGSHFLQNWHSLFQLFKISHTHSNIGILHMHLATSPLESMGRGLAFESLHMSQIVASYRECAGMGSSFFREE